jgi:hypothetical protein
MSNASFTTAARPSPHALRRWLYCLQSLSGEVDAALSGAATGRLQSALTVTLYAGQFVGDSADRQRASPTLVRAHDDLLDAAEAVLAGRTPNRRAAGEARDRVYGADVLRDLEGVTAPLTEIQRRVMDALDGRAMTGDALAAELRVDRSRLIRDHLRPLQAVGRVANDRKVGGYYRPDAPPAPRPKQSRRKKSRE